MKKQVLSLAFACLALGSFAQNVVKNGTFDTPLNEEINKTVPASADWFVLEKANGGTVITAATDDDAHGNVVQIENTNNNSWYKAYLGQRLEGLEKGVYAVSFEAKAVSGDAEVRFFICDAKSNKVFIMREKFDLSNEATKKQSAAAYSRKLKDNKWNKVTANFDFARVVDAFASAQGVEAKGGKITESAATEDTYKNLILVIQLQNKDSKALIDNVSVVKK